jgi:hypothetical protein
MILVVFVSSSELSAQRKPLFTASSTSIFARRDATFKFVSLANNHILDFGREGMRETLATLQAAGIKHAGVGLAEEASQAAVVQVDDDTRVAFLSYSDHYDDWAATETQPGINFVNPKRFDPKELARHVQAAKVLSSTVIVFIHWGPNWAWGPSEAVRRLGRTFIDLGAAAVFGHSSHHVQGIEVYRERCIVYGAGGFVDDYALDEDYRNDLGFIYKLQLDSEGGKGAELLPRAMELVPIKIQHDWRSMQERLSAPGPAYLSSVHVAHGRDAAWLKRTMTALCKDMGTEVGTSDVDEDNLVIHIKKQGDDHDDKG